MVRLGTNESSILLMCFNTWKEGRASLLGCRERRVCYQEQFQTWRYHPLRSGPAQDIQCFSDSTQFTSRSLSTKEQDVQDLCCGGKLRRSPKEQMWEGDRQPWICYTVMYLLLCGDLIITVLWQGTESNKV